MPSAEAQESFYFLSYFDEEAVLPAVAVFRSTGGKSDECLAPPPIDGTKYHSGHVVALDLLGVDYDEIARGLGVTALVVALALENFRERFGLCPLAPSRVAGDAE